SASSAGRPPLPSPSANPVGVDPGGVNEAQGKRRGAAPSGSTSVGVCIRRARQADARSCPGRAQSGGEGAGGDGSTVVGWRRCRAGGGAGAGGRSVDGVG